MYKETLQYLDELGFDYKWLEDGLKEESKTKKSKDELKKVYRKKSKEVHPDVSEKDGTEFEKLLKAYNFILEILNGKIKLAVKEEPKYKHGRNLFEVVSI